MKQYLLREPSTQETGGGLKVVNTPAIKSGTPPPNVEEMPEFKTDSIIDGFEIEQLPPHSGGDGQIPTSTTDTNNPTNGKEGKDKVAPTVVEKPKQEGAKEPKESKTGTAKEQKKETTETAKTETEKQADNPLLKILKAPGAKKEEVAASEASKGAVKPITPTPGSRDYTGFSTEEADLLKQMSNPAFEMASRLIKENKELGKLRETTYLQHEHGYLLDPQFQALRTDSAYAVKEARYWEEQLAKMAEGQDWNPIASWDAQGNAVVGPAQKADKLSEERVRMAMNNCYQQAQQINGRLSQYPTTYKNAITNDLGAIQQYRKQQFAWVQDPKLLDYTINIEGLGDRSLKQIREDVRGLLPIYMRSHPLTEIIGDLAIAVRVVQSQLAEAQTTQAVQQVKKQEQERIEPSSKDKPHSTGDNNEEVHGIKTFSSDPILGL